MFYWLAVPQVNKKVKMTCILLVELQRHKSKKNNKKPWFGRDPVACGSS